MSATSSTQLQGGSSLFGWLLNDVYGDARADQQPRLSPYPGRLPAPGTPASTHYPSTKTVRFATDPQDSLERVRERVLDASKKGHADLGLPVVTDTQLAWLQRKQEFTQYDDFLAWCSRNLPRGTPEERRLFDRLVPELAEVSTKYRNESAQLVAQLVKIRRDGPENRQDLVLMYMLSQGMVRVPTVGDMLGLEPGVKVEDGPDYVRGLWSPARGIAPQAPHLDMTAEQGAALGAPVLPYVDFQPVTGTPQRYWRDATAPINEVGLLNHLFSSFT